MNEEYQLMLSLEVVKTLYIGTEDTGFLKYEILADTASGEIMKVAAYSVLSISGIKAWQNIPDVDMALLDGWKNLDGVIALCEDHRKQWKKK
jgi:hypothetical protein